MEPTLKTDVRLGKISPSLIWGFPQPGQAPVLEDHPEFHNHRTHMDRDLINEIKEAGRLIDPIRIRITKDATGKEVYILIDGKTRMTAVAEYLAENPDTDLFDVVEFIPVKGTDLEAYILMGLINFEDSRKPWSDLDTARFLISLDDRGVSPDEQAKMLNKTGRGGVRWINEIKAVANNPVLEQAVEDGAITMPTAKQIAVDAKKTGSDPKAVVEDITKQKQAGVSEAEAKKNSTSRSGNRTTLGWNETRERLADIYPEVKRSLRRVYSHGFDESSDIDWDNEVERDEYLEQLNLIAQFHALLFFMKINQGSLRDKLEYIETLLTEEEKEDVIDWFPPYPSAAWNEDSQWLKP